MTQCDSVVLSVKLVCLYHISKAKSISLNSAFPIVSLILVFFPEMCYNNMKGQNKGKAIGGLCVLSLVYYFKEVIDGEFYRF